MIIKNEELGFDPAEHDANPIEKDYRDTLADGLEQVLGGDAETLEQVVKGLNENSVAGPGGAAWTTALLEAELNRLGR